MTGSVGRTSVGNAYLRMLIGGWACCHELLLGDVVLLLQLEGLRWISGAMRCPMCARQAKPYAGPVPQHKVAALGASVPLWVFESDRDRPANVRFRLPTI